MSFLKRLSSSLVNCLTPQTNASKAQHVVELDENYETPTKKRKLSHDEPSNHKRQKYMEGLQSCHETSFEGTKEEDDVGVVKSTASHRYYDEARLLAHQLGADSSDEEDMASPEDTEMVDIEDAEMVDATGDLSEVSQAVSEYHLDEVSFMISEPPDSIFSYDYDNDTEFTSPEPTPHKEGNKISPLKSRYQKIPALPTDGAAKQLSRDELRSAGLDEADIELRTFLAHRGHEPILPVSFLPGLQCLPLPLFASHDTPLIQAHKTTPFHAEVVFRSLMNLGGYVRTSDTPHTHIKKAIQAYMRWAQKDSCLGSSTLPMIRLITAPKSVDDKILVSRATKALQRLCGKHRAAYQARQTTELTQDSTSSTQPFYTVPTLYAFVVCGSSVALAAMRSSNTDHVESVAFLDFEDADLDLWNALALAITICHTRDVQMKIAKDTGADFQYVVEEVDIDA